MKINNFKRFGVFVLTIIVMVIAFIGIFNTKVLSKTEITYIDFTVSENDTLWKIANNIKQNNINYENKDIREIVYEIKKINNMDNSNIYKNEIIKIPEI